MNTGRMSRVYLVSFFSLTFFTMPALALETSDPNKNPSSADAIYRKSLEVTQPKTDPLAQYEKAMLPIYNLAIQESTAALAKNPKDAKAYARRAEAYAAKKDFKSALPDYEKALQLDPSQSLMYGKRAIAYFMMKDYDKSWVDVHKAQELKIDLPPAFLTALKSSSKREK